MAAASLSYREEYYGNAVRYREVAPIAKEKKRIIEMPRPHIDTVMRTRALILVMVLTVVLSVLTMRSVVSAMRGYELVQMQRAAAQLENENKQLEVQIAHLRAPQRIKDIATNDLGMIMPKNVYFAAEKQ
ncbi:MAG: cell division protein FtsL [Schwartzia sp.]|nr:cell division protein FtsL [Schwartzia sp. (in: firmicutes)]